MKKTEIIISPGVSTELEEVINDYWAMEGNRLLFTPSYVGDMHNMHVYDLKATIKRLSYCEVTHGNCIDCGIEIKEDCTSHLAFRELIRKDITRCNYCTEKFEKSQEEALQSDMEFTNEISEEELLSLDNTEKHFLKVIISKGISEDYYAEDFGENYSEEEVTEILMGLKVKGLINTIKDNNGDNKDFLYHPSVGGSLREDKPTVGKFHASFIISKNLENDYNIPFKGSFKTEHEVLFKEQESYSYEAIVNVDGSLTLIVKRHNS